MKKYISLISIFALLFLLLSGCSSVNSNPSGGSSDFLKEISVFAETNDFQAATELMNKYYEAYNEDQRKEFFMCLEIKLESSKYDVARHFLVVGATEKKYTNF